jgi:hypothetical protein
MLFIATSDPIYWSLVSPGCLRNICWQNNYLRFILAFYFILNSLILRVFMFVLRLQKWIVVTKFVEITKRYRTKIFLKYLHFEHVPGTLNCTTTCMPTFYFSEAHSLMSPTSVTQMKTFKQFICKSYLICIMYENLNYCKRSSVNFSGLIAHMLQALIPVSLYHDFTCRYGSSISLCNRILKISIFWGVKTYEE